MDNKKKHIPPCNEDQQLEIEALGAIFMEDFTLNEDGSFSILVVPSMVDAQQNHVQIKLSVLFPEDYPNVPPTSEHVTVDIVKGGLGPVVAQQFKEIIVDECQTLVGQQMIFMVIEKLKEHLELYNWTVAEGSMNVFSDETIFYIMSFLDARDLALCAMVNTKFNRVSEENGLWEPICREEDLFKLYSEKCPPQSIPDKGHWKKYYLNMKNLAFPGMNYLAAIVSRRGTNDDWSNYIISWKNNFITAFEATSDGVILRQGQILHTRYTSTLLGHYRFKSKENIERKYKNSKWWDVLRVNVEKCPYLEDVVGFIEFQPVNGTEESSATQIKEQVIRLFIESTRGIIVRLDKEDTHLLCVQEIRLIWGELINQEPHDIDQVGLLVSPRKATSKVKYLSDLVTRLNKKIDRIIQKEGEKKSAVSHKGFKTFLDFQCPHTKVYYPFTLDDHNLCNVLNEKFGTIWAFPTKEKHTNAAYSKLL